MKKKNGSVLIICLWILSILTVLAVGLGYEASIDLKLARNQKDRIEAYYLCRAGLAKSIALLKEDIKADSRTKDYDTIYECGIDLMDKNPLEIFKEDFQDEKRGFYIGFMDEDKNLAGGFTDEAARININGSDHLDYKWLLKEFFELEGVDDALVLSEALADWIDEDTLAGTGGEEDSVFKNASFRVPEELLFVLEYFYRKHGKDEPLKAAEETFSKLESSITLYSRLLNINTISADMLKVVFRCAVDMIGVADITKEDADSLASKIEIFRHGEDGSFGTRDDNVFSSPSGIADNLGGELNAREAQILDKVKSCFCVKSDIFRIHSTGRAGRVKKEITAVYNRNNNCEGIIYWHER